MTRALRLDGSAPGNLGDRELRDWEATGPPWFVFRCGLTGQPMKIGFTAEEYAEDRCHCGASLIPISVVASQRPAEGRSPEAIDSTSPSGLPGGQER